MLLSAPGFAKGGILREGLAGGDAILFFTKVTEGLEAFANN